MSGETNPRLEGGGELEIPMLVIKMLAMKIAV